MKRFRLGCYHVHDQDGPKGPSPCNMPSRKQRIREREREIERLEARITAECVEIGRRCAEPSFPVPQDEALSRYLQNITGLRGSIRLTREEIDRARGTLERIQTIENDLRENTSRIREREREEESQLADLGAGAWARFQELTDKEKHKPLFSEVLAAEEELDRVSAELTRIDEESRKAGFFEKIRIKARKIMLRGSLQKAEQKKTKAFRQSAASLLDSDFIEETRGELRSLFDHMRHLKKERETLAALNRQKEEELISLREETGIGGDEDISLGEREAESRIKETEKELEVLYCWAGQRLTESGELPQDEGAGLNAKLEIIGGMRETIRRHRDEIGRLQAAEERQSLDGRERDLRQNHARLESELEHRRRELAAVREELEALRLRKERLREMEEGKIPYASQSDTPPVPPSPSPPPSPKNAGSE